jgi:hypothetical protein
MQQTPSLPFSPVSHYHGVSRKSSNLFSPLSGWSVTESTITEATTGLLYQPWWWWMMMSVEQSAEWLAGENRSARRKPAPISLSPPQIPHHLTRVWTQVSAMGIRWLHAWVTAPHSNRLTYRISLWKVSINDTLLYLDYLTSLLPPHGFRSVEWCGKVVIKSEDITNSVAWVRERTIPTVRP